MQESADNLSPFRCLAIETATQHGSVAVCDGENTFTVKLDTAAGSSRQIYHAIDEALGNAALTRSDLTVVAFGNGPGSFTGVRVATATAQSLAFALAIPVIPVSTLAAVAVEVGRTRGAEPVAVCLDARMGEVYVGVYDFAPDGAARAILTDQIADPAQFDLGDFPGAFAAGPGWEAYPELSTRNAGHMTALDASIWPGAAAIAVEARELYRQGHAIAAHEALPNYVRNKVTY